MSETVERLRRWVLEGVVGESAESVLVVLVFNEREAMEVMEEDGVCVLRDGGGVENVRCERSGSNGELDGDGEGV
jgi:hypothetical protein